jgi:hypothetical protein
MAPLYISIAALLVGMISLGWQIYKELGLRARLVVSVSVEICANSNTSVATERVVARVANHGPGEVTITKLVISDRRRGAKDLHYICVHPKSAHSGPLPCHLKTGEQYATSFPINREGWLSAKPKRFGALDAFDRVHWASSNDIVALFAEVRRRCDTSEPADSASEISQ